jgi:hypothetical protein
MDKHGIDEDNWGRCGMPRDWFQPDTDDLILIVTLYKNTHPIKTNTYLVGIFRIFRGPSR